jgi:HK97 family phage major capsid protein
LGENTAETKLDVPTDSILIKAYKFASKSILIPEELLQDDSYNLEGEVPDIAATRIARHANRKFTLGTGTNEPLGLTLSAANSNVTIAANTLSSDKLYDLMFSVNSVYRPTAKFMFNDATLAAIYKLSVGSDDDRPLWQMSMREGAPDTIAGKPYVINDFMPTIGTATNRAILFGDFSKFLIRIVKDFTIKRTDQRHIETFQIGFYAYARMDCGLVNSNAIKYLSVSS